MCDWLVYLNNCKGRDHARIYGREDVFYDLNTTGVQATQANDLPIGQECVVVSPASDGRFTFIWYSLRRETILSDDTGTPQRVLFGEPLTVQTFSKKRAARSKRYFNVKGHFKQQSAIVAALPRRHRPTRGSVAVELHPEEVDPSAEPMYEGGLRLATVNAYERNPAARKACLDHYGYNCAVCEFTFAKVYGDLGQDFIHVHQSKREQCLYS